MLLRKPTVFWILWAYQCSSGLVRGDGGLFVREAADLAQTRQEAVMAIEPGRITYVLRFVYQGRSPEFAWVIPTPDTPTDVVAHADARLFRTLDDVTRPAFYQFIPGGNGCACGGDPAVLPTGIVQVEARGQAGIFDWAALTSAGSTGLLQWLGDNGFAIPGEAAPVLDAYIAQGRHFLAIRVRDPADLSASDDAGIPPLQFSVATSERFYPLVISQVSAADQEELILYVLSDHRAEAANVPNITIDPARVVGAEGTGSSTNYEQLFTQAIADAGGPALVTESVIGPSQVGAGPSGSTILLSEFHEGIVLGEIWPQGPVAFLDSRVFLTRLRTVLTRENMSLDLQLRDATTDDPVSNIFLINGEVQAALPEPIAGLCVFAAGAKLVRRRARRR